MRTNAKVVTIIAPKRYYAPADRKRKVIIADKGQLKVKQLRRLLEAQELSKNKAPDERLIVKVPDTIIYELTFAHEKMGKRIGSLNKALNRKSREIAELRQKLDNQIEAFGDTVEHKNEIDIIFGSFGDLLDAASEFAAEYQASDNRVLNDKFATLCNRINESNELISSFFTAEPEEAMEEEKDDQS